jgi:SM-20-related protein
MTTFDAAAELPGCAAIVDAIADGGIAVVPSFLDESLVAALRRQARERDARGEFLAAGTGRGAGLAHRLEARGDRIAWIDAAPADAAESAFLASLDRVRLEVNRALAIGAFELEAHYAIYPPGAGYVRHRDRFRDDDARVLSLVAYLNDGWREADGGALRVQVARGERDILPTGGTLVAFLSDATEHEVLPARRERLAIAAWFRRRRPLG